MTWSIEFRTSTTRKTSSTSFVSHRRITLSLDDRHAMGGHIPSTCLPVGRRRMEIGLRKISRGRVLVQALAAGMRPPCWTGSGEAMIATATA